MYHRDSKIMFARKIVPQYGPIRAGNVHDEVRAVSSVCMRPTHENIVEVLGHGPSPDGLYYFFDMELCDWTLKKIINSPLSAEYMQFHMKSY